VVEIKEQRNMQNLIPKKSLEKNKNNNTNKSKKKRKNQTKD
jgi:hypothetical protein